MSECRGWECEWAHFDADGDPSNGCERECEPLEIEDGERYDIELPVVHVDGTVAIDAESAPDGDPGYLVFESLDTESNVVETIDRERGAFEATLYSGYYRIVWLADRGCGPGHVQCPSAVLREFVHISGDTTLALDGPSLVPASEVEVSGRIRINGEDLPERPNGGRRAVVTFWNPDRRIGIDVGPDGPASFAGTIPTGRYDVLVEGDGCADHELPCQRRRVAEDLEIDEATEFDWDLESVRVSGQVTVHGTPLSGSVRDGIYGAVHLTPAPRDAEYRHFEVDLQDGDAGQFEVWMYPGRYTMAIDNQRACPASRAESANRALPCAFHELPNTKDIGPGHRLNIDLDVARVTGEVKVNGGTMADSPSGRSRGVLMFSEGLGYPLDSVDLGESGPAQFDLPIYPGEHTISVEDQAGFSVEQGVQERVLPDERHAVREIDVNRSQELFISLPVYEWSGRITVDGEPLVPNHDGFTVDTRSSPGLSGRDIPLVAGEQAAFSTKVYGGREYSLWMDVECSGEESDTVPCGQRRLAPEFTPTRDLDEAYDLSPINVTGELLVNGERADGGSELTWLRLTTELAQMNPRVVLDDQGRFEFLGYPGTYDVFYQHQPDRCTGAIPCGQYSPDNPIEIRPGESVILDVPTAKIRGEAAFTGSQAPYPTADGTLTFNPNGGSLKVPVEDGHYGPIRFVAGSYHRVFQRGDYWKETCASSLNVPCHRYRTDVCQ